MTNDTVNGPFISGARDVLEYAIVGVSNVAANFGGFSSIM